MKEAGGKSPEKEFVAARMRIAGRVQGVCFRAYTRAEAKQLGVHGWVRNLRDGRVEVLAEGARSQVEALIAWCHHGPPSARVDEVAVAWQDGVEGHEGFEIAF